MLYSPGGFLVTAMGVFGLGVSFAFLYLSISLQKLLIESPHIVQIIVIFRMAFGIISSIVILMNGMLISATIRLTITLVIGWYLLQSVQRLSAKLKSEN